MVSVACSSSSTTVAASCEAGESEACACGDGSTGTRICDADGKHFSQCDCDGSTGGASSGGSAGSATQGGSSGSSSTAGGNGGGATGGNAGTSNGGTTAGGAGGSAGTSNGGATTGGAGGSAGNGGSAGAATGGSGGTGGSASISCPPGMAAIANTFCMDRWELKAQLPIAPTSTPNQTPLTNYKPKTLRSNCQNAGKRLCTLEELAYACSNSNTTLYPYGNAYSEPACGGTALHATGTLNTCVSEDQVYDLVGNVWELAEFGSDVYATLFGGDHRRDGAATFSCCIRTQSPNAYPAGCDALYDSSDALDYGTNTTSVEVDALTHTKDVYDRDIDLGYRCCSDPM